MTVRLPASLANRLEQESLQRGVSKSDIVRERLSGMPAAPEGHPVADILLEIDSAPAVRRRRNGEDKKKALPGLIRAHYRAAKRHYR